MLLRLAMSDCCSTKHTPSPNLAVCLPVMSVVGSFQTSQTRQWGQLARATSDNVSSKMLPGLHFLKLWAWIIKLRGRQEAGNWAFMIAYKTRGVFFQSLITRRIREIMDETSGWRRLRLYNANPIISSPKNARNNLLISFVHERSLEGMNLLCVQADKIKVHEYRLHGMGWNNSFTRDALLSLRDHAYLPRYVTQRTGTATCQGKVSKVPMASSMHNGYSWW